MKYDKPFIAGLIGIAMSIPVEIYTQILKYFGLNQLSAFEMNSIITFTQGNWWIGLLAIPGVTFLGGLLVYEMGRYLGIDYLPLKGAFVGYITYGVTAAIFGNLGRSPIYEELTVSGHYVHASAGFLAGLLGGYLIKKYVLK